MKNYSQYVNHIKESLYGEMPLDSDLQILYPGYDTPAQRAMRWKQDQEIALRDKELEKRGREDLQLNLEAERNRMLSKLGEMITKAQKKDLSFLNDLVSLMEKYPHLIDDTSLKLQPMTKEGKPARIVGTGADKIPGTQQNKPF